MAARKTKPVPRWQQRMAVALTPADRMSAAYDHLLTSMAHLKRRQRDPVAARLSTELAEQLAAEAAAGMTLLARRAEEYDPERVVARERRIL